jgi:hypothetical protein
MSEPPDERPTEAVEPPAVIQRVYEPRLVLKQQRTRQAYPRWQIWHGEQGGVTYEYDLVDWAFRVGFFMLGLIVGCLLWQVARMCS